MIPSILSIAFSLWIQSRWSCPALSFKSARDFRFPFENISFLLVTEMTSEIAILLNLSRTSSLSGSRSTKWIWVLFNDSCTSLVCFSNCCSLANLSPHRLTWQVYDRWLSLVLLLHFDLGTSIFTRLSEITCTDLTFEFIHCLVYSAFIDPIKELTLPTNHKPFLTL